VCRIPKRPRRFTVVVFNSNSLLKVALHIFLLWRFKLVFYNRRKPLGSFIKAKRSADVVIVCLQPGLKIGGGFGLIREARSFFPNSVVVVFADHSMEGFPHHKFEHFNHTELLSLPFGLLSMRLTINRLLSHKNSEGATKRLGEREKQ
jgi:hypothetical protein